MLYLPRRHRRKLLLPPGLLALAFLLLVGCGVLGKQSKLRQYSVIILSTPNLCGQLSKLHTVCVPSAAELEQKHNFRIVSFTGDRIDDKTSIQLIQKQLYAINAAADSVTFGTGLAIRFYNKSRYTSFIGVLNELNITETRRWFFHIYAPVPTIYVFPNHGRVIL